ncbi:MAG TPA: outer membrane beta-barrel protein [Chitinophagales bacterium]|nr:outer membrane beta-barrel protein [Chitinophagales bacterium]
MKPYFITFCFLAVFTSSFAGVKPLFRTADEKDKKAEAGFWHHTGEFHIAPSADYYIYGKGKLFENPEPYEFQMPFIGFDIGGQYMYRPVEVFAISAGLGFRMQGSFYRHTTTPFLGDKYVDQRILSHTGFLNVPVEFHLFKRMNKCTFEFATGPRFNFPVLRTFNASTYAWDGEKVSTVKDKDNYTTTQMKDLASLGWNLLFGAEVHLFDHGDLFIGPQINFTNLVYFDKEVREGVRDYGNNFNCSLGLKLGFRFHCETTAGY